MTSEQPFDIAVSDDAFALLKPKLDDTRLPDEVNATECACGAPLADIKQLHTYERGLNALPMFTCTIMVGRFGELSVRYVYQRSTAKDTIPLLFVPWSDRKFPGDDEDTAAPDGVFPGLRSPKGCWRKVFMRGITPELFNKLTISLGYSAYVTQGGDRGHVVRTPHNSKSITYHGFQSLNTSRCLTQICPYVDPPSFCENPITQLKHLISSFTARERQFAAHIENFFKNGRGYSAQQAPKPQTLGFSLTDPLIGLLAWICEKPVTWTDAYPWTETTKCSRFIGYRAGPAPSVRIYYELALVGQVAKVMFESEHGSAGIPRRTNLKRSSATFGRCSASRDPRRPSFQDVPAIDRTERIRAQ
ncbi:alpha/beta-hydrolase [Lactarius vividus]|nr:alpha/beta-hydrolase [Lactarius vividus]